VIAGSLVKQCVYSRLAKSEAPELVLLTVARGKKACPKQHSDCNFIGPLVILRGSQTRYKRGNEWTRRYKFFSFLVITQAHSANCFQPDVFYLNAVQMIPHEDLLWNSTLLLHELYVIFHDLLLYFSFTYDFIFPFFYSVFRFLLTFISFLNPECYSRYLFGSYV